VARSFPRAEGRLLNVRFFGSRAGSMKCRFSVLAGATAIASSIVLQSHRAAADPTTADCLAASEASFASRDEHRLRTERSQVLVCAATSCPATVRKECIRRAEEISVAIPTIIFEARDSAGNQLSAVKVTMDGEVLAERLEGTALSVDPGAHTFVFETVGQLKLEKQFVISAAQKDRLERINLGPPVPSAGAREQTRQVRSGLGTQRILAIAAAGIGVVGIAVGGVYGLVTLSKRDDARSACPNLCADTGGVAKWSDAKSAGNISTAAFVVGGLALTGGAVLWFTAPSDGSLTTDVGVGPASLQLRGTW
jgi:hypothetical protein